MDRKTVTAAAPDPCISCLSPHLLQSYDTELLLSRESACVPVQPVVVVKRESEPAAISFMGALRIPVSHMCTHKSIIQNTCLSPHNHGNVKLRSV